MRLGALSCDLSAAFLNRSAFSSSFGARRFRLAGRGLDIELRHHAILDEHRIALRADAKAALGKIERQAERFGEIAAAVGEKADLVRRAGVLGPGDMTNTSLTLVTAISSIFFALNASACSAKPGRCMLLQVGVKAPGTPISTTLRPLKIFVGRAHRRTLGGHDRRNWPWGSRSPILIVIACLHRAEFARPCAEP